MLGAPRVRLRIAHPGPRAIVSVKLNDVSPAGDSQPVTRGAVNLACAARRDVELDLMATGWRFRPGHRIRVAVAANDWPCLWPLPQLAPIDVDDRRRAGAARPAGRRASRASAAGELVPVTWTEAEVEERPSRWEVVDDPSAAGVAAEDWSGFEFPGEGLRCEEGHVYSTTVSAGDPLSARVEGRTRFVLQRPGLDCVAEARATVTCSDVEFEVDIELEVTRGGEHFHGRRWNQRIPRNGC